MSIIRISLQAFRIALIKKRIRIGLACYKRQPWDVDITCHVVLDVTLALMAYMNVAASEAARIIAIGDLHGDYNAFEAVMVQAGLMVEAANWAGGTAIVIQQGDIAGRGPDTLKIVRALKRLENEAAVAGGKVIILVGNHEVMQMAGDLRYVHSGEWASFVRDNEDALYKDFFHYA